MAEVASSGADVKENEAKKLTISRVVASLTSDSHSVPIIMVDLTLSDLSLTTASLSCPETVAKRGPLLTGLDFLNEFVLPLLLGKDPTEQAAIDELMTQVLAEKCAEHCGHGPVKKATSNLILAVSLAVCKAGASIKNKPLYKYIMEVIGNNDKYDYPTPAFKVINSGESPENKCAKQHFMIIPTYVPSFRKAIIAIREIYRVHLKDLIIKEHGQDALKEDDAGGYNLDIPIEKAAELLFKVIDDDAGFYTDCIRIGVEFCGSKLSMNKDDYSSFRRLVIDSPIVFIKNPFHQDNVEHYTELTKFVDIVHYDSIESRYENIEEFRQMLADEMELGRDITAIHSEDIIRVVRGDPSLTNRKMLKKAIRNKTCNSLLLEVNQLGCITECMEILKLSKQAGWKLFMAGHYSCELDADVADIFVGFGAFRIEIGVSCIDEHKPCNMCNRLINIDLEAATENVTRDMERIVDKMFKRLEWIGTLPEKDRKHFALAEIFEKVERGELTKEDLVKSRVKGIMRNA